MSTEYVSKVLYGVFVKPSDLVTETMTTVTNCGHVYPQKFRFCPECGIEKTQKIVLMQGFQWSALSLELLLQKDWPPDPEEDFEDGVLPRTRLWINEWSGATKYPFVVLTDTEQGLVLGTLLSNVSAYYRDPAFFDLHHVENAQAVLQALGLAPQFIHVLESF